MRIHISETTHSELMKAGIYHMIKRGSIVVKVWRTKSSGLLFQMFPIEGRSLLEFHCWFYALRFFRAKEIWQRTGWKVEMAIQNRCQRWRILTRPQLGPSLHWIKDFSFRLWGTSDNTEAPPNNDLKWFENWETKRKHESSSKHWFRSLRETKLTPVQVWSTSSTVAQTRQHWHWSRFTLPEDLCNLCNKSCGIK